jgi:hypothetical protein
VWAECISFLLSKQMVHILTAVRLMDIVMGTGMWGESHLASAASEELKYYEYEHEK